MSSKQTRQSFILRFLHETGQIDVSELSDTLHVSQTTIRKDLEQLEEAQQLVRVYGGARLPMDHRLRKKQALGEALNNSRKELVAKRAAELVNDNEIVFLGSGTTCIEIARQLKTSQKKLTIVSNNLTVLDELKSTPGFNLLGTGGQLENFEEFSVFHGDFVIQFLEKVLVQKAFLTADGVSLKNGYTTHNRNEYHLFESIRKISEQLIFVVESKKFEKNSILRLAEMDSINTIITDEGIPEEYTNYYLENGKALYIAADSDDKLFALCFSDCVQNLMILPSPFDTAKARPQPDCRFSISTNRAMAGFSFPASQAAQELASFSGISGISRIEGLADRFVWGLMMPKPSPASIHSASVGRLGA